MENNNPNENNQAQQPSYDDSYNFEPPQKPKKKKGMGGIIAIVAVAGIVAGVLLSSFVVAPFISNVKKANEQMKTELTVTNTQEAPSAPALGGEKTEISDKENPVVEVFENVSDSVVSVVTYAKEYQEGQEPVETMLTAGTGFVISEDGYILTNHHVAADGNLVKVIDSDGKEYVADVIGTDAPTEIAVLKVDGLKAKPVAIGDSDAVKVGEMAIAIGNPVTKNSEGIDFSSTLTVGYISAVNREIVLDGQKFNMFQTDAAINPGNSGGPLVNDTGEVIGVNTAKKFYSGYDVSGNALQSEGIGYAIPMNKAMEIAQKLIQDGSIPRAGIGLTYGLISADDAQLWETPRGALVAQVVPGGAADKAGIKQNDIITELDGVDLTKGANMPVLSERAVGDTIQAKIWREGKELSIDLILQDLNETQQ
ncbi:MAG: trypsin-like peptidase domain-containing protein [Christensenellaceae bacterium]